MDKMKCKRIITTVLMVVVLMTAFIGCRNETTEFGSAEDTNKDENGISTGQEHFDNSDTDTTIKIGDYVTFGNYEQDNDTSNGSEVIEWQVVDVSNGNALLVSKYILDNIRYNDYGFGDSENYPWAQSYVYSWLNNDFAKEAFTEEERKIIADTTESSVTDEDGSFIVEQIGSVFLLSYDEIVKYFDIKNVSYNNNTGEEEQYGYSDKLLCKATPYAICERGIEDVIFSEDILTNLTEKGFIYDSAVVGNSYSSYWLSTSFGWDSWFTAEGHAFLVEEDGTIKLNIATLENIKTHRHGIRPCVWVNLANAEDLLTVAD